MLKALISALALGFTALPAFAQATASAVDVANLRADVQLLTQQLGDLSLQVERLAHENADLRAKVAALPSAVATVGQLNASVAELRRLVQSTDEATRQTVADQIKKLADQTNAALDALTKGQTVRATDAATFSTNYPKEGISYSVLPGENLSTIALKTGSKVQDIINANKIADPTKIRSGQKLFIPGGKTSPLVPTP